MEQVTIDRVFTGKNGWFDIKVEDGRRLSTRIKKLADQAKAAEGTTVLVELTEKQNGEFTNYYLNKVAPLADENGEQTAVQKIATATAPAAPQGGGRNRNDIVGVQWAYGRAVEIATMKDDLTFPLDDESVAKLTITAESLLAMRDKTFNGLS